MRTLNTKAGRLESLSAQFDNLLTQGYTKQEYKGLNIFTSDINGLYLKIFRDTSSNHICFYRYRTTEQRTEALERYKSSYDRSAAYKAESKANPTKSTAANCAAAIREELKKGFPSVKFTVKSDNFAGGNSVHIGWTDGCTSDQVEAITDKYQYGHFNSMEDIYEYTNTREDLPQAKYVSASRKRSEETTKLIENKIRKEWAEDYINGLSDYELNRMIYEQFVKMDLQPVTEVKTEGKKEPITVEHMEVVLGEVQIIAYGEKAIAVIGDTKAIKDKLKALGGKFNFRLSCGAGWIFKKSDFERVTQALNSGQIIEDVEETAEIIPQALKQIAAPTTLKEEINKTLDFFADHDLKTVGEVTESTKECFKMQGVDFEERVKQYDSLKDIEEAAKSGRVISLCNLSNLVNRRAAI